MLQAGELGPVTEATPWINSFVLNKAIIHVPYHFKMPDDIAHLIVDACIMTVCDC